MLSSILLKVFYDNTYYNVYLLCDTLQYCNRRVFKSYYIYVQFFLSSAVQTAKTDFVLLCSCD